MSHTVVKILVNDDGDKVQNPVWHLSDQYGDANRTLCQGEVYGFGESEAEYKEKEVERGGITCNKCLEIIKRHKAIKL